jgi:ribosomal protein L34
MCPVLQRVEKNREFGFRKENRTEQNRTEVNRREQKRTEEIDVIL